MFKKSSISYFNMSTSEFVRKFLSFYEIKGFISMLKRPCHRFPQGAVRILLHSQDRVIIIYFNFICSSNIEIWKWSLDTEKKTGTTFRSGRDEITSLE
jgi:hypothetical protein